MPAHPIDFQLQAGFFFHAGDEVFTVRGLTARFCGDQSTARNRTAFHFGAANFQPFNRLVHRFFAQLTGFGQASAEPHNAREAIHHAETAARGFSNQKPAIVGA